MSIDQTFFTIEEFGAFIEKFGAFPESQYGIKNDPNVTRSVISDKKLQTFFRVKKMLYNNKDFLNELQ